MKKWVNKQEHNLFKIYYNFFVFVFFFLEIDLAPSSKKTSSGFERILEFGKELSQMGQQLEKESKMSEQDRQMLEVSLTFHLSINIYDNEPNFRMHLA